jgi:protocatechuate 3,4-dioxygenase beta subunit
MTCMTHDLTRRRALTVLTGGAASAFLAACGGSDKTSDTSEIPDETAGPYPGDGSNGPNALADSGVVRKDITSSFGGASGTADGVPTTIEMTLLDVAKGGAPLAGAAVYLWHCTADGQYSMYDPQVANENFLRGVQESDKDGRVTFTSIFPGAYAGRWPHIHFEVYESLDAAAQSGTKLKTSQIALPQEACDAAYASDGYTQSVQNLASLSLDGDMVFSDGYGSQLATASGDADSGITLKLNVGV